MKYHNKKVTYDGITFDSKKEARRYCELRLLQKAGDITDLELQKEFVLIPNQYKDVLKVTKKGDKVEKKLLERAVKYKADFVYRDKEGNLIVEDTKGLKTKDYIIKRKLMLYIFGIQIKEI